MFLHTSLDTGLSPVCVFLCVKESLIREPFPVSSCSYWKACMYVTPLIKMKKTAFMRHVDMLLSVWKVNIALSERMEANLPAHVVSAWLMTSLTNTNLLSGLFIFASLIHTKLSVVAHPQLLHLILHACIHTQTQAHNRCVHVYALNLFSVLLLFVVQPPPPPPPLLFSSTLS